MVEVVSGAGPSEGVAVLPILTPWRGETLLARVA
ncbi:hypothetical protein SAMN05421812_10119 [Asanoa hainanensis]|uniref:Uncharacterized protein n=1 Tax=Asanoa hainanensis TaxID=560556 RepID=A0A239FQ41_9ACTN|nr:hypothetical protein SAMN05421812_10119 [Asanoa hainanensis]